MVSQSVNEGGRAVGLISGGLDSTVVAAHMMNAYQEQIFVFSNYGQKTLDRELRAFRDVCDYFAPNESLIVDMTWLSHLGGSALFDSSEKLTQVNRKSEYVPFRNAVLLSGAVAVAEAKNATTVLIGSTGGDTTCPDNSPAFLAAFQGVIDEGTMTESRIKLVAPLIHKDKEGVIRFGQELGAPFALSWSCHNNLGSIACGACSNCESRRAAFDAVGLRDPLEYEDEVVFESPEGI